MKNNFFSLIEIMLLGRVSNLFAQTLNSNKTEFEHIDKLLVGEL